MINIQFLKFKIDAAPEKPNQTFSEMDQVFYGSSMHETYSSFYTMKNETV